MRKRILSIILAVGAIGLVPPAVRAQNVPIEYGPYHGPWECLTLATNISPGTLSYTTLNIAINDPITAPVFNVAPVFSDGGMRRWIEYTDPGTTDYWATNVLRYVNGGLSFSPTFPASLATTGPHQYAALAEAGPASLLAWWPAAGNGSESIYGKTAFLTNGAAYATGKVGQGFSFDGVNDFAYAPDTPYHNVGISNDFTIECWIRAPSDATGTRVIVEKIGVIGGRTQGFSLVLTNGILRFQMWSSSGTMNPISYATSLLDDSFHHVAVSVDRDSTTGGNIYVDGDLEVTFNPTPAVGDLANPTPLKIGANSAGAGWFFKGIIDEVSLYQCALTGSDIQVIHTAGTAGKCWNGSPAGCGALPLGCVCGAVSAAVGTVTIYVSGPGDTDGDGLPDSWEQQYFSGITQYDDNDDPDGDGVPNLIEFWQGRNPTVGAVADSGGQLALTTHTPLEP